jgi:ABC-type polysaccharide/polyol phosphate transport system ATPase subunit
MRDNLVFVSRLLGFDARRLIYAVQRFCDLTEKQMRVKVKEVPPVARKRAGLVVCLAADFDCHLIDGGLNMRNFGAEGAEAQSIERAIFGRDYIFATSAVKQLPQNCDLAYILYDGRLYYFDDIQAAVDIFTALPVPIDPGGGRKKREDEDDDEPVDDTAF